MTLFLKLVLFCVFVPFSCIPLDKFFRRNRFDMITGPVVDVLISCVNQRGFDFITLLTDSLSEKGIRLPSKYFDFFNILEIKGLISGNKTIELPPHIFDYNISQKTEIILAIVSSPLIFQYFLKELKQSKLWNRRGFYLIIDSETLEKDCERAYDFLQTSWNNDILRSTFFCINLNNDIVIYTYNPYTKWAPQNWQEASEESRNESTNNSWTLYSQKLISNQTTCTDLDFPKDLIMSGQEIKAIAIPIPPTLTIHSNKTGWAKYDGIDALITKALITKMNASLRVTLADDSTQSYGYSNSNKIGTHSIFDIIGSGEKEILLNGQYIFNKPWNTSFLYPHMNAGISVLTRYAGFETGPSKILRFMNPKLIFGTCLVFLITVLVLGVLAGEGIISACLEVLRIMIGVTVIRMPRRTPIRIYLITVIQLFLITGSTFQGSLSSILTSPIALPNIDSIEDLRKSTYTVYVYHEYENAIIDEDLLPRMILTNHWNCSKYVLEQEGTACASERSRLTKIGFEHNVYVSKHRLTTLYSAFIVRPNWPLISRFSRLLQCMCQFGLINYWLNLTVWAYKPKWLVKQRVMKSSDYRSMTVSDLEFAFYILLIGLISSIAVFLIERFARKKCLEQPRERKLDLPPLFEYTE